MQGFSSVRAPVLARDGKQYQAIGYQPDQVELGNVFAGELEEPLTQSFRKGVFVWKEARHDFSN
jgi:hypothetical protein